MHVHDTPIEELDLSVDTYNALKRSNILTVGQILALRGYELLNVRDFDRRSYYELRQKLVDFSFMSPFELVGPFAEISYDDDEGVVIKRYSWPVSTDANDTPIEALNLSVRTYNCLKRSDVTKVSQIMAMHGKDLLSVRNMGRKSIDELRKQFINHGLMTADKPVGPFAEIDFGDDQEGVVIGL